MFYNHTVCQRIEKLLQKTEKPDSTTSSKNPSNAELHLNGSISFPDAFAEIVNNEVFVKGLHISEYSYSSVFNHNPDRVKKLLLHKEEIKRLKRKTEEKGYTLIPIDFYLKNGRVKLTLGICKGKKQFDKRASIKERDVNRDIQREFRKGLN